MSASLADPLIYPELVHSYSLAIYVLTMSTSSSGLSTCQSLLIYAAFDVFLWAPYESFLLCLSHSIYMFSPVLKFALLKLPLVTVSLSVYSLLYWYSYMSLFCLCIACVSVYFHLYILSFIGRLVYLCFVYFFPVVDVFLGSASHFTCLKSLLWIL